MSLFRYFSKESKAKPALYDSTSTSDAVTALAENESATASVGLSNAATETVLSEINEITGTNSDSLEVPNTYENEQSISLSNVQSDNHTLGNIDVGPMQPVLDKYNPTKYGAKSQQRDFKASWYSGRDWLEYCTEKKAA